MKRFFASIALALYALAASAVTLSPVQLLNPAGSTSGQAAVSTGPSTPPAWGNVTATALAAQAANTVVANVTASSASPTAVAMPSCSGTNNAIKYTSGTGFTCGSNFALLTGSTFTGAVAVSPASGDGTLTVNAVNANTADLYLQTGGVTMWGIIRNNATNSGSNAGSNFQITRNNDAGASIDNPFVITRSTGVVTMVDGIANSPISGSTGSFTTLSASSTVSGTGFSTYLASPPAIGGTAPGTGKFTTLQATNTITPSSTAGIVGTTTNDSAQAGSVGETITATASGVAQTSTVLTNVTSIPLTAGQWDVTCSWTGSASSGTAGINFGLTTTTGAQAPVGQRVLLGVSTSTGIEMPCPNFTLKLASSATLFLTSAPTFSGTMTVGGTIWAVRRR